MISTDRKMFLKGSAVLMRQIEYAKQFDELHIIVFSREELPPTIVSEKVRVYSTRSGSRFSYIRSAKRIAERLIKERDITFVTCQDPFETGLVGASLKKRFGLKLELQLHTDIGSRYFKKFNILNSFRVLIAKRILHRADSIRVVSERIKMYLVEKLNIDSSKITVRPIYVDVEKIKETPAAFDLHRKYPQFRKIILVVSRLEPEKNVAAAIAAVALLKDSHIGLIIVGGGSRKLRLQILARKLGISNNVMFEGWQNDTVSYYKSCDVFLSTSWYEGYGMALVEAHAAGCAIVSTDVGVAKEVGATIVPHNPAGIARGLKDML